MRRLGPAPVLAVLAALLPAWAGAQPVLQDILASALGPARRPYSGTLVMTSGGGTIRKASILHAPGNRYRRVILGADGRPGREVVSDGKVEWTYDPSRGIAWKGAPLDADYKLLGPAAEFELLARNYGLQDAGEGRVAGVSCRRVAFRRKLSGGTVSPHPVREACVDALHGVVLRSRRYGRDGALAAESRFESIEFPRDAAPGQFHFEPPPGVAVRERRGAREFIGLDEARARSGLEPRLPGWLPPGFVFESVDVLRSKKGPLLHLRFSDGLQALSMFQCAPGVRVARRTGAASREEGAREWESGGERFVLVGRLPAETLARVAESVR